MVDYDVVLIHPPSLYDFRKEIWFPGPIDRTVPNYTPIFIMFPIGLISIGAYLQDRGYKVKIINLAEEMINNKEFNVEQFLFRLKSNLYAIDLHWTVHSQGAIKIAELCKKYHPDSKVVLGGLTATYFADEIISNFNFVDYVVRGEGERPLFELICNIDKVNELNQCPNLTFLDKKRGIVKTEDLKVIERLDSLDFTRLSLVEPRDRTITSPFSKENVWMLPICRGCIFNCATCGGSCYSYKKLMNRERPAFRSPRRLFEDLKILDELRINHVFLFQDPRLGGKKYVKELLKLLKNSKWSHITSIGLELFYPAGRSFLNYLSRNKPAEHLALSISPESGAEFVRSAQGRVYSNEKLLLTCRYCREGNIPLGVFFMSVLGHDTPETIKETWKLWEKIFLIEEKVRGLEKIYIDVGPLIFLDPGSLAFEYPKRYGYKIRFKRFHDYYQAFKISPHWSRWINYEIPSLGGPLKIAKVTLQSLRKLLEYKRKFNRITDKEYWQERFFIDLDNIFISEFDKIIKIRNFDLYQKKIRELAEIAKDRRLGLYHILINKI